MPRLPRRATLLLLGLLGLSTLINVYDYRVFRNWFIASQLLGVFNLYAAAPVLGHEFRVVYPPLAPLLFLASLAFIAAIYPSYVMSTIPAIPIRAALKAPIIALLYVGYSVLERRVGPDAAKLFIFNIVVLAVINVYSFDIPATVAALLAIYSGASSPVLAAALTATATLLKQSFALLVLPLTLYYATKRDWRSLGLFATSYTTIILCVTLPFLVFSGFTPLLDYLLLFHAERLPQGVSIWMLPLLLSGYNIKVGKTLSSYWVIPFVALLAIGLYRVRHVLDAPEGLEVATTLVLLAFLATSKVLNPQYMVWPIPFLAALAARGKARRAYKLYTIAALLEVFYPVLYITSAAVVAKPFFLEEEARWAPASMAVGLVEDSLPEIGTLLLAVLRSQPFYSLFELVYTAWPFIHACLALAYTTLMLLVFVDVINAAKLRPSE